MTKKPKVCIIGAENWGSAIAVAVGNNVLRSDFDKRVHIYVYDELVRDTFLSEVINMQHENIKYLPGIQLPENLIAVNDLLEAARHADILLFATPQSFIKSYCNLLAGHVKSTAYAVSMIKGLDRLSDGNMDLHSHSIAKQLGIPCYSMMCASSAMEMAQGKLCEITIGCNHEAHAKQLTTIFQTDNCKVVAIDDVDGVELCNTLKDVLALGAGIIDGLRLGDNARVTAVHLGLKEMMRFIKGFYPNTQLSTFFESCGVAHSVASCYADKNVTFAKNFVISGKTIQEMEENLLNGKKLLGPLVVEEVNALLEKENMQHKFPLFTSIHKICQSKAPPDSIIDALRNHPDLCNSSIKNLMYKEQDAREPKLSSSTGKSSGIGNIKDIGHTLSNIWNPFIPMHCPQSNSLEDEPELAEPDETRSVPILNRAPHKLTLWLRTQPDKQVNTAVMQDENNWYDDLDISAADAGGVATDANSWLGNDDTVDNEKEAAILLSSSEGNDGGDINASRIVENQMSGVSKLQGLNIKVKNAAEAKAQSEPEPESVLIPNAGEARGALQERPQTECLDKVNFELEAEHEQIASTAEETKQTIVDDAKDEPKSELTMQNEQLKQAETMEDEQTKEEDDIMAQLQKNLRRQDEFELRDEQLSAKLNEKLAALQEHIEPAEETLAKEQESDPQPQYIQQESSIEQTAQLQPRAEKQNSEELKSTHVWNGYVEPGESADMERSSPVQEDKRIIGFYSSDNQYEGQNEQDELDDREPVDEEAWNWLRCNAKFIDKHDEDRLAEFYLQDEGTYFSPDEQDSRVKKLDNVTSEYEQDTELTSLADKGNENKRMAQEPATPAQEVPVLPERQPVATPKQLIQPHSEPPPSPQTKPLSPQQQQRKHKVLPEQADSLEETRERHLEAAKRQIQKMTKKLTQKNTVYERETARKADERNYAEVEYSGPNPYSREPTLPPEPPTEIREHGSNSMRRKLVVNPQPPFNPPLNPRIPAPRPPFDARTHEYHTLAYWPLSVLLRTRAPAAPPARLLSTMPRSRTASLLPCPFQARRATTPAAALAMVLCTCFQVGLLAANWTRRNKNK